MSTPIYRAEITLRFIRPAPAELASPGGSYLYDATFTAKDGFNDFGILVLVFTNFAAGSGFQAAAQFFSNATGVVDTFPSHWTFITGTHQVNGPLTDAFAAPEYWTIAIEKDFDADEVRWISPWGTETRALSSFTSDTSVMRPNCIGDNLESVNGGFASGGLTDFGDFYGSAAGVPFIGAALTSSDPGAWTATSETEVSAPGFNHSDAQNSDAYQFSFTYAAADAPRFATRRARCWDGGDNLNLGQTDLIHASEHGAHWGAVILSGSRDTLAWRRTHDKGGSWATGTIYTSAGTQNSSPSIGWFMGRVLAVWHNGTAILQSFSLDLGATWSTPLTLAISGRNPRHLLDPATGFSWYFYIDGSDLKVKRSGDFGASFIGAVVTVATGVSAQTVAAQLALDGSLIVGYVLAGAWTQKRSTDLGLSWS